MQTVPAAGRSSCLKKPCSSLPILADARTCARHHQRGTPARQADRGESSLGKPMAVLLGAAAGLGLLLPGASLAIEQPPAPMLTQVSMEAPGAVPLLSQIATEEVSEAPDLVTDLDVELAFHAENPLVTGLEWMMEEGLEVTNFSESNFAAVGAPSSSMWLSNSPWCLMWDAYCNVLTTRPVATKLATGMVGTFLGDMLAQFSQGLMQTHSAATATFRGRRNQGRGGNSGVAAVTGSTSSTSSTSVAGSGGGGFSLDLSRTARLVGFSALVGTPVAFVWFNLLDQYVVPADPTSPMAVFFKVALDQVLMAPCMTSMFFATMALLGGTKPQEVPGLVKAKLKPTLLANWTVWPLAHVINFALVPPAQRILYINVINIAWTAFMSHVASSSSSDGKTTDQSASASSSSKQQLQQARR